MRKNVFQLSTDTVKHNGTRFWRTPQPGRDNNVQRISVPTEREWTEKISRRRVEDVIKVPEQKGARRVPLTREQAPSKPGEDVIVAQGLYLKYGDLWKSGRPGKGEIRRALGEAFKDLEELRKLKYDIGERTLAVVTKPLARAGLKNAVEAILTTYWKEGLINLPKRLALVWFTAVAKNRETPFREVKEAWDALKPNQRSYNAHVIFIERVCTEGNTAEKDRILANLGTSADDEIWAVVLKGSKNTPEALETLTKIKIINERTMMVLQDVMMRAEGSKGAEGIFPLLKERGIKATTPFYNNLLKAYKAESRLGRMTATLSHMKASRIPYDVFTFYIVLRYCRDNLSEAGDVYDRLASQMVPSPEHHRTSISVKAIFVTIHAKAGRVQEAQRLYSTVANSDRKLTARVDEDLAVAGVRLFP